MRKERVVLRAIHLRTTGRHLSMGSHSVICHPTEVTAPLSKRSEKMSMLAVGALEKRNTVKK